MLQKMKNKLSAGVDQIPTKVLKAIPDDILIALSHVFNLSTSIGEFISSFKLTKVCPVFKNGNLANVNNYRPISLLSTISKLFEKIIYRKLYLFFEKQNFFYKQQFGF